MVGWLVGCSVGWLIDCLFGWLVDWLVGWLTIQRLNVGQIYLYVIWQIPVAVFANRVINSSDYIREIHFSNFGLNAITFDRIPVFSSGPLQKTLKNISVGSSLLPSNPFP